MNWANDVCMHKKFNWSDVRVCLRPAATHDSHRFISFNQTSITSALAPKEVPF